jgi:hypothetical protein
MDNVQDYNFCSFTCKEITICNKRKLVHEVHKERIQIGRVLHE